MGESKVLAREPSMGSEKGINCGPDWEAQCHMYREEALRLRAELAQAHAQIAEWEPEMDRLIDERDKEEAVSEIPRRNRMDQWCDAERAIQASVDEVERMGADPLLTEAVILLGKARDRVADYVDRPWTEEQKAALAKVLDTFENAVKSMTRAERIEVLVTMQAREWRLDSLGRLVPRAPTPSTLPVKEEP